MRKIYGEQFTCSKACQKTHIRCRGCDILTGGEHLFTLKDDLCYEFVDQRPDDKKRTCWYSPNVRRKLVTEIPQNRRPLVTCVDCDKQGRFKTNRCSYCQHKHLLKTDPDYKAAAYASQVNARRKKVA